MYVCVYIYFIYLFFPSSLFIFLFFSLFFSFSVCQIQQTHMTKIWNSDHGTHIHVQGRVRIKLILSVNERSRCYLEFLIHEGIINSLKKACSYHPSFFFFVSDPLFFLFAALDRIHFWLINFFFFFESNTFLFSRH